MEKPLLVNVHQHILDELRVNTKTDIVFVLASIVINVVILATNSILAMSEEFIVMGMFTILLIVVNLIAEVGLIKGRQTRNKLLSGLIRMYEENDVDGYYDRTILDAYNKRYTLFMVVVLMTGLVAMVVPIVVM